MSPPQQLRQQTSNCSSLLIYRARKDERLSRPSWLPYSGWFTHISGHQSATGRAQDSESTPAKDRCYTAGPRNQHIRAEGYRDGCQRHPNGPVWFRKDFMFLHRIPVDMTPEFNSVQIPYNSSEIYIISTALITLCVSRR